MEEKKPTNYFIVTIILIIVVAVAVYFVMINRPYGENPIPFQTETFEYVNTQYGFNFALPASWEGYSIINQNWEGNMIGVKTGGSIKGPEVLIRHPLWTIANKRQDIPIMVFTLLQWDLIQKEKLSLGAAPIPPSELGSNANYVFALPARYDFAFTTGFEEVESIIAGNPLRAF